MNRAARQIRFLMLSSWIVVSGSACATVQSLPRAMDSRTDAEITRDSVAAVMTRARDAVPLSPGADEPSTEEGARLWHAGMAADGLRILVSTESRALWLMRDSTVLLRAPVAVGMEEGFVYRDREYDFRTPLSQRAVLAKATMPLWVPPDWHYFEIAVEKDLAVVPLKKGKRVELSDGTYLELRGDDVGRVNQFGNFWAFTPGAEIIFDGNVYVPPFGSRQRQVPDVLGTHKLVMGDGYLIHGTNEDTSVGDAVSHGCVRMYNEDVAVLHDMVPVGTPVFIY